MIRRKFLALGFALAYFAATVISSQAFLVNAYQSFPLVGGTPAFSYRNTYVNTANQTNYTFTASDLGTADAARLVIVGVYTQGGNPTAVSVDGTSATRVVESQAGNAATEIWQAASTANATGDIVVTVSVASNCIIHVWAGYPASATAVDSALNTSGASPATLVLTDLAKTNGGFTVLMAAGGNTTAFAFTQNGAETIVENFDGVIETTRTTVAASHINTATTTTDDYTVTFSVTSVNEDVVGASWGP